MCLELRKYCIISFYSFMEILFTCHKIHPFKCIIRCFFFFVYLQSDATINRFQNILSAAKEASIPISGHLLFPLNCPLYDPQPQAITSLSSNVLFLSQDYQFYDQSLCLLNLLPSVAVYQFFSIFTTLTLVGVLVRHLLDSDLLDIFS